jgi:hypothetical protein
VVVYGAYGHTGRFIVAELCRRGWKPLLCGRDAGKLASMAAAWLGLEWRAASVDDPDSLDRVLRGAAAVVNAAGPFLETAAPMIEAALRAGAHYFDTSAEQRAAYATFERYGARMRDSGLVAMPSVAFYGALADLLATAAMGDWPDAEAIDIAVGLDYWHPTPGTRITGERNRWRRWVVEQGQLCVLPDPAPAADWTFPEPLGRQEMVLLPLSEIVVIAHHLRCQELHAYMNLAPLRDIRDPHTPPPVAVDASGRSAQTFVVDVRAYRHGRMRRAVAQGQDIYAVSAPLVVEALQRVMAGQARGTGSLAAGEAFDAEDFLRALAPQNLSFVLQAEDADSRQGR